MCLKIPQEPSQVVSISVASNGMAAWLCTVRFELFHPHSVKPAGLTDLWEKEMRLF